MVLCGKCGKNNEDSSNFCVSCGEPLLFASEPEKRRRKPRLLKIFVSALIIMLFLLLFLLLITLINNRNIITENFNNNKNKWFECSDSSTLVCDIKDSCLNIFPHRARHFEFIPCEDIKDFFLTFDIIRMPGHEGDSSFGSGVVFKYTNDTSFCSFIYTIPGLWKYQRYFHRRYVSSEWDYSKDINKGYSINKIEILCNKNSLYAFINEKLIREIGDCKMIKMRGKIGFYITSGSNTIIDNVNLKEICGPKYLWNKMPKYVADQIERNKYRLVLE